MFSPRIQVRICTQRVSCLCLYKYRAHTVFLRNRPHQHHRAFLHSGEICNRQMGGCEKRRETGEGGEAQRLTFPACTACALELRVTFLRMFFSHIGTFAILARFFFAHARGAGSTDQNLKPGRLAKTSQMFVEIEVPFARQVAARRLAGLFLFGRGPI